jgi:hypothetical protein
MKTADGAGIHSPLVADRRSATAIPGRQPLHLEIVAVRPPHSGVEVQGARRTSAASNPV